MQILKTTGWWSYTFNVVFADMSDQSVLSAEAFVPSE